VKDDKIVFAHYSDEFAIDILNAEAKLLHSIRRSDPRIPFTGKDRQAVLEYWKHHSQFKKQFDYYKENTVFPQYYPALSACRTAGKKIYAVTHLRKQGKSECFVYDMDGKFQKRIFIPLWKEAPYEHPVFAIFDGHLFQIIDNLEEETWELHIHPIE
jgi:hypothetical protein